MAYHGTSSLQRAKAVHLEPARTPEGVRSYTEVHFLVSSCLKTSCYLIQPISFKPDTLRLTFHRRRWHGSFQRGLSLIPSHTQTGSVPLTFHICSTHLNSEVPSTHLPYVMSSWSVAVHLQAGPCSSGPRRMPSVAWRGWGRRSPRGRENPGEPVDACWSALLRSTMQQFNHCHYVSDR